MAGPRPRGDGQGFHPESQSLLSPGFQPQAPDCGRPRFPVDKHSSDATCPVLPTLGAGRAPAGAFQSPQPLAEPSLRHVPGLSTDPATWGQARSGRARIPAACASPAWPHVPSIHRAPRAPVDWVSAPYPQGLTGAASPLLGPPAPGTLSTS